MPIHAIPHRLPEFSDLVSDLNATPRDVAKCLDVGTSTVYHWLQTNNAPRPAKLALFWVSRWGLSTLDCELHNRAMVYEGLAQAMQRELWEQKRQFERLAAIGHYGSANDPLPHVAAAFGLDDARMIESRRPAAPRSVRHAMPSAQVLKARR